MNKSMSLFNRMSIKEQAIFARRLSFLIRADVPILEALTIMQKQSRTPHRKQMFQEIVGDVSNGQFLSASLVKFRHLFGDFAIDMIRVGEESGMLDENLNYLADELQKKQALQQKIIGALVYPAFITLATCGITGLITIYIFPKILPIFKTMHVTLPLSTRLLMGVSGLLLNHGFLIFSIITASIIGSAILLKKSRTVQMFSHRLILLIPFFGRLLKSYFIANICRTCGLLLQGHFGIMRAMQITGDTTANLVYQQEIRSLTENIRKGQKISPFLEQRHDLFPDMVTEMISIGEKTGNLSGTFLYLATYYENEVNEVTKNLSSTLEPILMVLMGAVVGFVAISVITPIYAITQHIHR